MKNSSRNTVRPVTTVDLPEMLPPPVTRSRQYVAAVLAQSLLETGGDGRAALAWSRALTGTRPSPVTLALPPGEPPSREAILAEADADPEGSTAPPGVPSDYCDQLGDARGILTWLTGVSDEIPVDDEHRGRFIGARDDYAPTDEEIHQVRSAALRSLAAFDLPEPMDPAAAADPWRWEPKWMNAAWQRGIRDLLDWVLGDLPGSPLTGRPIRRPAAYDLSQEDLAAEEAIALSRQEASSRRRTARMPPRYCEAIQAAICWLRGETVRSPIQSDGRGSYGPVGAPKSARHSHAAWHGAEPELG